VGGVVLGAGSVVGRTAYVGVIGPNIGTFGFDVKTGKRVYEDPFGEYNPIISNGRRVFLTGSSKLMALQPKRKQNKHGGGGRHGAAKHHGGAKHHGARKKHHG
jgi:hypothetical protein